MKEILKRYLPELAVEPCFELIKENGIFLKVVNERKTRHGDYKKMPDGTHRITVNASVNRYRFLITLIHEISHLAAIKQYGDIKPHGVEWKQTFRHLMSNFLVSEVFPDEMIGLLEDHFKNPRASSDTDTDLNAALQKYDVMGTCVCPLVEVARGEKFRTHNGKIFKKGIRRTKLFECTEEGSGRVYLFNPNAAVEPILK